MVNDEANFSKKKKLRLKELKRQTVRSQAGSQAAVTHSSINSSCANKLAKNSLYKTIILINTKVSSIFIRNSFCIHHSLSYSLTLVGNPILPSFHYTKNYQQNS